MTNTVHCHTASASYDITIAPGAWQKTADFPGRKLLVSKSYVGIVPVSSRRRRILTALC